MSWMLDLIGFLLLKYCPNNLNAANLFTWIIGHLMQSIQTSLRSGSARNFLPSKFAIFIECSRHKTYYSNIKYITFIHNYTYKYILLYYIKHIIRMQHNL